MFALAIFFVVFVDDPDVLLPELASLQLFGRRAEAFAERFLIGAELSIELQVRCM